MFPCNTFPRSVAFGALAAIGWIPWVMLSNPLIGVWYARALYLIAILMLYVGGQAASNRVRVAFAAGVGGSAVVLFADSTTELIIGLALALGVSRGVFLYRVAAKQAVVREAILLSGGLLLARLIAAAAPAPTALALWGFFLVQSFFFLLPAEYENPATSHPDPFEEAHRRALAILERDPPAASPRRV